MEDLHKSHPSTIEDLSISYYENGLEVVKELAKEVLTKGAWTTIMYKYQEWQATTETYGPIKFTIRRYQKQHGVYRARAKFNISNLEQATKIIDILTKWTSNAAS